MLLPLLRVNEDDFTVTINNNSLLFLAKTKELREFADGLDEQEGSEENHHFIKILCMVHLVIHPGSVYADYPLINRIEKAIEGTEIEKDIYNSEPVQNFLEEYQEILDKDTELGFITDVYQGINNFRQYFTHANFTKTVKGGAQGEKLLYSAREMASILKDLDKTVDSILRAKQKFAELLTVRGKSKETRANRDVTRYESKLNRKK